MDLQSSEDWLSGVNNFRELNELLVWLMSDRLTLQRGRALSSIVVNLHRR
jgi:hypothetical protein